MNQSWVKSILSGSSLISTGATIAYVGWAYNNAINDDYKPAKNFNFPLFVGGISVAFGLYNAFLNKIDMKKTIMGFSPNRLKYIIGGGLFGVGLTFVGSTFLEIPKTLNAFGYSKDPKKNNPYLPLQTGWLLYAIIWGVFVYYSNSLHGVE